MEAHVHHIKGERPPCPLKLSKLLWLLSRGLCSSQAAQVSAMQPGHFPYQPGKYIKTRCVKLLWTSTQELRCWADVLSKMVLRYSAPNTSSILEDHGTVSRGDLHQDELLAPPTAQCLACLLLGGRGAPTSCPYFSSCCEPHQQFIPSLPPMCPPPIEELSMDFHLG